MKIVQLFFGRVAKYGDKYLIGEWQHNPTNGTSTPFFKVDRDTREYTQKEIEDKYNLTINGNRIMIRDRDKQVNLDI